MKIKRSTAIKNLVKSKKTGHFFLILIVLAILGYLGYHWYTKMQKPVAVVQSMNSNPTVTPSKTPDGAPAATSGASTIAPASVSMTPTIVPSSVSTPMSQ